MLLSAFERLIILLQKDHGLINVITPPASVNHFDELLVAYPKSYPQSQTAALIPREMRINAIEFINSSDGKRHAPIRRHMTDVP